MASRYTSSSAGWRRVLRSQGVQDATGAAAERRAALARSIAPVLTGEYRASIHVEPGPDGGSRIVADSDHAIYVEAQDNVLGRAIS